MSSIRDKFKKHNSKDKYQKEKQFDSLDERIKAGEFPGCHVVEIMAYSHPARRSASYHAVLLCSRVCVAA